MSRRSTRKRKSSPAGMQERLDARRAAFVPEVSKGGAGGTRCSMPGSLNPRKH